MSPPHLDITGCDTLPKLLARNGREAPDGICVREKMLGIWRRTTWAATEADVRRMALGLLEIGIVDGDVVAIIGDNRAYWTKTEIAAHAIGACSLGLYRDALEEEIAYLLDLTAARIVVAEDEEQVDKILALKERLPHLERVVYVDPRGMRKLDDPCLLPLSALMEAGDRHATREPGRYEALVAAGDGERPLILCPTSGTTSHPKLAMLRPAALIRHAASYLAADPRQEGDDYVSILPLAWIMEQVYALAQPLVARMIVNFVEEPETMMEDLREIGPSFVLFAPRQWEQIAADVHVRVADADILKRTLYRAGRALSLRALDKGRTSRLGSLLVNRALRDRLGLTRLKSAATGGAALGPDTFRFFQSLGVPLRQLYGQTELIGAYTMHRDGDVDHDTVGRPFNAQIEVRIAAPDANGIGEIVTRHPNMFSGYFRNPEATAADLRDGWFHTGDAGYIDAKGHLVVIDRVRDLATLGDGTRYSPQYLENKLKFSPNIAEAVAVSDGRQAINALICIRYAVVARWAERRGIAFTTYADLAANPEVATLIRADVEAVNRRLPAAQRFRRCVLLYKELDADDGELTRTRKLRRSVIAERYRDIIGAMSAGAASVDIDTTITLQDGGSQRVVCTLAVVTCDPSGTEGSP